jgi:hypothetical protein
MVVSCLGIELLARQAQALRCEWAVELHGAAEGLVGRAPCNRLRAVGQRLRRAEFVGVGEVELAGGRVDLAEGAGGVIVRILLIGSYV